MQFIVLNVIFDRHISHHLSAASPWTVFTNQRCELYEKVTHETPKFQQSISTISWQPVIQKCLLCIGPKPAECHHVTVKHTHTQTISLSRTYSLLSLTEAADGCPVAETWIRVKPASAQSHFESPLWPLKPGIPEKRWGTWFDVMWCRAGVEKRGWKRSKVAAPGCDRIRGHCRSRWSV